MELLEPIGASTEDTRRYLTRHPAVFATKTLIVMERCNHLRREVFPVCCRAAVELGKVRDDGAPLLPTNHVRRQLHKRQPSVAISLPPTVLLINVLQPGFAAMEICASGAEVALQRPTRRSSRFPLADSNLDARCKL